MVVFFLGAPYIYMYIYIYTHDTIWNISYMIPFDRIYMVSFMVLYMMYMIYIYSPWNEPLGKPILKAPSSLASGARMVTALNRCQEEDVDACCGAKHDKHGDTKETPRRHQRDLKVIHIEFHEISSWFDGISWWFIRINTGFFFVGFCWGNDWH